MDAYANELVELIRRNRVRHGKSWRKVRLDRLHKLFPLLPHEQVLAIVAHAFESGLLLPTQLQDGKQLVPAVRLAKFDYPHSPHRWKEVS